MAARYRKIVPHAILFFICGAIVHLLLLKHYLRYAYAGESKPEFVYAPLLYVIVAACGGLSVAWLFLGLMTSVHSGKRIRPLLVLTRGGFYGVAATVLTVAGSSVLGAVLLSSHLTRSVLSSAVLFFIGTMEIGTYALGSALASLPYALLYGVLGGAYVLALPRSHAVGQELLPESQDTGRQALIFAALGLLFILIPFVGLILSALAVFYGYRTIRSREGKGAFQAKVGVALGGLCIAVWMFSFVVYGAASLGWLGNQ